MSRRTWLLIGGLMLAAFLTCGCLGSAILFLSTMPPLSRWAAPYGIEGRELPSESVTMENMLPEQVGEYTLTEVVEPLPPMMLDLTGPSKQGNYTHGVQGVHLIGTQMKSLEEAHNLVAQVDGEVERAGAVNLNGNWRAFARWPQAWKMSRLAWDKWYVRFGIPAWGDQAYGVAWNNGSWFFMATSGSKSAIDDFVIDFDY